MFDLPPQPVERYLTQQVRSALAIWRVNQKRRTIAAGATLRLDLTASAIVHWSFDGWQSVHDTPTRSSGLGTWVADLPTVALAPGAVIVFTLYWTDEQRWEGRDYDVRVVNADPPVKR